MDDPKLRRARDQLRLRLENRGKGLIEIAGYLAEILAVICSRFAFR
jgi:hypothetical protein